MALSGGSQMYLELALFEGVAVVWAVWQLWQVWPRRGDKAADETDTPPSDPDSSER